MNTKKWLTKNTSNLSGKVVAITGETGGLGQELCFYLASLDASIIMLNRSMEKSFALKNKIIEKFPNANIEIVKLDLGKIQEVKEAGEILQNKKIDYLILNAGIYNVPLKQGDTGYNNIFEVNFISPYYLTKSLLATLRKSGGKVVMVSSIAHRFAKFDEGDIDHSKHKRNMNIYGNSKRFLMFALYKLFENESEAKLAIVHPGVTPTQLVTHYHKSINWLVKFMLKLFCAAPKNAALNLLDGVFEGCLTAEWIGPKWFDIWGKPKKRKVKLKRTESEQIFNVAEEICNVIKQNN